MENKAGFIKDLNRALIVNGGGRYDYLDEFPMEYRVDGHREYIMQGDAIVANITMDSLRAILIDLGENASRF